MFGPQTSGTTVNRPFGAASVDGFDMDFEAGTSNMTPFASALRSLMTASTSSTGKKYYLSAAPQCPFPDAAMGDMISSVGFDFVGVQFYNNYCGAGSYVSGSGSPGNNFNFARWHQWATTESPNKGVKVLLGVPGSASAAGSGYVSGDQLKAVIQYSKTFSSFGGVMIWWVLSFRLLGVGLMWLIGNRDMSQVYANSGFLDSVVADLGGSSPVTTPPASTTTRPATTLTTITTPSTPTSSAPATGTLVPQWGQCGGNGYTGSTQCQPPYRCVAQGAWWSSCVV